MKRLSIALALVLGISTLGCQSGYQQFYQSYPYVNDAEFAAIVLTKSEYTNTQTTTSTLFLPTSSTRYHSGTAAANTIYFSGDTSSTTVGYIGTGSTRGTKAVPYTTHQRRYDQEAVYLAKWNGKFKFGVSLIDLTPESRTELQRNMGAFVELVIEDTPAFYANLLPGDVLIAIDNTAVRNVTHALELMRSINDSVPSSDLTVIRNGQEASIHVTF